MRPSAGTAAIAVAASALAVLALVLAPGLWHTRRGPIELRDLTARTGIRWRHTDGSSGKRYIVETVSAGLATFDYDGDGLVDIYFVNGAPLRGTKWEGPPPRNALYRNLGNFRFEDVTEQAGVGDTGYGLGVTVGDYDNDGRPDLFVSNFGPHVLYRNNGDGTFSAVTEQAGVAGTGQVGAGACFLDIEGGGDLDLFVAYYVHFDYDTHPERIELGYPVYPGPLDFDPLPAILFRNNGDGTFSDISRQAGVADKPGTGMGIVAADYDNDGDPDIFVLNDVAANFLFRNDGQGHFEEVGLEAGFSHNIEGRALGSMGIDCADYDNDGLLDFFQTAYQNEPVVLYRNLGHGVLEDVTARSGAGSGSYNNVNWGCGFVDFDNDGWRDLFIAMGHLQDNVELYDATTSYEARNLLLRNRGDGTFDNVSDQCGDGLRPKLSSRGAAFDDLDNDGRVDVVVLNSRREPTVLRNTSPAGGHWLQVELRGTRSNRDAVGARVTVTAGGRTWIDEVHSGRGYQSHWGSRLHFGLGEAAQVDRIEVRWPGGHSETFGPTPADRQVRLIEGAGQL